MATLFTPESAAHRGFEFGGKPKHLSDAGWGVAKRDATHTRHERVHDDDGVRWVSVPVRGETNGR